MIVSFGNNVNSNKVERLELTADKLKELLVSDKQNAPYITAGLFENDKRKKSNFTTANCLIFDFDYFKGKIAADFDCITYVTPSSTSEHPRIRLIVPLAWAVTNYEDEIHEFLRNHVTGDYRLDKCSFNPAQPMFLAGHTVRCKRADKLYEPKMAKIERQLTKQADPTAKPGLVGAFCSVYTVYDVIEHYLNDVYLPGTGDNRFTYAAGHTKNGVVVYENGKFLFSHHDTDPVSGKLVNAYDLLRLHRNESANQFNDYIIDKMPNVVSYKMQKDFADSEENAWVERLEITKTGNPRASFLNFILILENDPRYNLSYDEFGDVELVNGKPLTDAKILEIREYIEVNYRIKCVMQTLCDAIDRVVSKNCFHPLRDKLKQLKWDGTPRIASFLPHITGCADNEYTQAVSELFFKAAVARALTPGCKYDHVIILEGKQGIGKSQLWQRLAYDYFTELATFHAKEAAEIMIGRWVLEVPELDAFNRHEVEQIKHFFSVQEDRYRPAYAKKVRQAPRQCVFVGTTNADGYLKDATGNRRFLPVKCGDAKFDLKKINEMREQLWAEAVAKHKPGEPLMLPEKLQQQAALEQEERYQRDPWEDIILPWLEQPANVNRYQTGGDFDVELAERDRVCIPEIWQNCLKGDVSRLNIQVKKRIKTILDRHSEYEKRQLRFGNLYGVQRGWVKIAEL